MKTLMIVCVSGSLLIQACTAGQNISQTPALEPPTEKAREWNFNYNQAKQIVNYTAKHKKARHRISNHNRELANDKWYKLNANKNNPDKRNENGSFRFYKNN